MKQVIALFIVLADTFLAASGCGMQRYIDEQQRVYEERQERLAREQALYRRRAKDRHHGPCDRFRGHHHSRYVISTFVVFLTIVPSRMLPPRLSRIQE